MYCTGDVERARYVDEWHLVLVVRMAGVEAATCSLRPLRYRVRDLRHF